MHWSQKWDHVGIATGTHAIDSSIGRAVGHPSRDDGCARELQHLAEQLSAQGEHHISTILSEIVFLVQVAGDVQEHLEGNLDWELYPRESITSWMVTFLVN